MNINRKKQSQFELFPGAPKGADDYGKTHYELKDLTLSVENIIVLCIISVMALVLFFSFGVERGRRVAETSDAAPEINSTSLADDGIIVKSDEAPIEPKGQEDVTSVDQGPKIQETEKKVLEEPRKKEILEKTYTIQVASFRSEKSAQKEAMTLKDFGYDIFVLPKGKYSIVCVGKFNQRNEAQSFSSKLKSRYSDLLVRRL